MAMLNKLVNKALLALNKKTNASHEVSNQMVCSSILKGGRARKEREKGRERGRGRGRERERRRQAEAKLAG